MNQIITVAIVAAFSFLNSCVFAQDEIKSFTEPYRSIEIAAPEIGTISQLTVKEGDQIQAGTILAKLNEEVLAASLAVAKETTQSGGALKSATAELDMQTEKYQKLIGLFQRRHASQTELDRAKSQLEIASAKVESVQDDLRIKTLEMQRIKAQLEQRRLRAPIDGVVTQIFKDEGEFVSPSDPRVMTVVQLNPLLVIFSVPQEQTTRLRAAQKLLVTIGDTEHEGTVEFVSPTADAQSGTCRVKVTIDNTDSKLASGQACFLSGFSNKQPKSKFAQTSNQRLNLSTSLHSK